VDKNPFAVDLAKLSLWLATFAKGHPFTFLDHSFRQGDSLVGLTFEQIVDTLGSKGTLFRPLAEARMAEAISARQSILDAVETTPYELLEAKYSLAMQSVGTVRDLGDAIIAGFYLEEKSKDRDRRRDELVNAYDQSKFDVVGRAILALRQGNGGVTPFHWQTEFPEVFGGDAESGFAAVVGNPPFLGGTRISTALGIAYRDFISQQFEHTGDRTDLVAYFFRRAYNLLRYGGTMGLIATNTIAQGDTRVGSLWSIKKAGGTIYGVRKSVKWPGQAAVVVTVVWIAKGFGPQRMIDGQPADEISAYLVSRGGDDSPMRLLANENSAFEGFKIAGNGFVFDDGDEAASPVVEKDRLLAANSRYSEIIRPYIGGEEVNDDPRQQYHRWVINFGRMSLDDAAEWPEALEIVSEKVKPYRDGVKRDQHRLRWWQYGETRPGLQRATGDLTRMLVCSQVSKHHIFAFIPSNWIPSHRLNVFAFEDMAAFAILQSTVHEVWARFFGGTLEDRPCYFLGECFYTFPFPFDWEDDQELQSVGEAYYGYRSELMIRSGKGLTAIYNRFHDKYDDDPIVKKLRDFHAQIDRAVFDAYGWMDLQPVHDFILDYEEPEDEQESGKARKKKEPWRYRWTDEFRDEVLARLLELNRQRAEEERKTTQPTKNIPKKNRNKPGPSAPTLAGFEETE
jgi:hypothetical protein